MATKQYPETEDAITGNMLLCALMSRLTVQLLGSMM